MCAVSASVMVYACPQQSPLTYPVGLSGEPSTQTPLEPGFLGLELYQVGFVSLMPWRWWGVTPQSCDSHQSHGMHLRLGFPLLSRDGGGQFLTQEPPRTQADLWLPFLGHQSGKGKGGEVSGV